MVVDVVPEMLRCVGREVACGHGEQQRGVVVGVAPVRHHVLGVPQLGLHRSRGIQKQQKTASASHASSCFLKGVNAPWRRFSGNKGSERVAKEKQVQEKRGSDSHSLMPRPLSRRGICRLLPATETGGPSACHLNRGMTPPPCRRRRHKSCQRACARAAPGLDTRDPL
jgi:hypothetical protein